MNDVSADNTIKKRKLSCVFLEDEISDLELITQNLQDDQTYDIDTFQNLNNFQYNWTQSKIDLASFDYLFGKENSTSYVRKAKKISPKTLVGYITRLPEQILRKNKLNFIISKNTISDNEYNIIISNLLISFKLFLILHELEKLKNENSIIKFFDTPNKTEIYDSALKILTLLNYLNQLHNSSFEKDLESLILWSENKNSENDIRLESITLSLYKKFYSYCRDLSAFSCILFLKFDSWLIIDQNLLKFQLTQNGNIYKINNLKTVLSNVKLLDYDASEIIINSLPFCLEFKFTSIIDIKEVDLIDKYLFFQQKEDVIKVPKEIFLFKGIAPSGKDLVSYILFPSGEIRYFSNVDENENNFIIGSNSLEDYFDISDELFDNGIEQNFQYQFWIILMEF